MNQVAVKDLLANRLFVAQVVKPKIDKVKDVYGDVGPFEIKSPNITVIQISRYSTSSVNLQYFDEMENAEKNVIVPNDYILNLMDEDKAKEFMAKYKLHLMKTLRNQLAYGQNIGSDPEVFGETKKGELIPAFKFLPSKETPAKTSFGYNNNLYWDGFQAEFTTQATSCMDGHCSSIRQGLAGIYQELKKFDKNAKLSIKTVFDIPMEVLKSTDPKFVAFGCAKSLNAYGMKGTEADGTEVLYRTAGGHIHFGLSEVQNFHKDQNRIDRMVKALDAILGVACVSLFAKFDNPKRREMYGLAGEYRLPPHGLEYRTLSNAWLMHPLIAHIVFDLARSALKFGDRGLLQFWEASEKETVEVINTHNVPAARDILKRNEKVFKEILTARYHNDQKGELAYDIILKGAESIIKYPKDLEKNWELEAAIKGLGYKVNEGKKMAQCFKQVAGQSGVAWDKIVLKRSVKKV